MARQTFYSVKYLKDSAGVNYAIFISHATDKINSITSGSGVRVSSESRRISKEGHSEIIIEYTGSGSVTLNFESGLTQSATIADVPTANQLTVPFDSLTRTFRFDATQGEDGYDISDALYYAEGTSYKQLVVFPESRNPHLDTSSTKDFYYVSDGSSPYIASTSLQNSFLNNIKYTNKGSLSSDLGKFRGRSDDNTSLEITASPDINLSGPVVTGGLFSVSLESTSSVIEVCLDPVATNYYLTGCVGENYPCTDSGVAHANDCDGTALTSTIINSSTAVSGSCCTYIEGCDNYSVVTSNVVNAAIDTADGSIDVTVTNGTANFTVQIDDISLENPSLVFNSGNAQTTTGITTSTFTVSNLLPGTYEISVSDSNPGTSCSARFPITIPSDPDTNPDGDFGCKDTASAINYDSSAATHSDKACVFCDEVTGKLFSDATNPITLGPWVEEILGTTQQAATSNPSGTSLSDGAIVFPGINFASTYSVLPPPTPLNFDPSAQFTSSNQASPIDYRLYLLDSGFNFAGVANAVNNGQNGLTLLAANSTLVTTASTTGGSNTFTGLAAGTYAIAVVYDNDGTQDGDDEVEQCYEVFGTYDVGQGGCTDGTATNFNPSATFDDGSCMFPPSNNCDGAIDFPIIVNCQNNGVPIISMGSPLLGDNPGLIDAVNNGFTITQGPAAGTFVDPAIHSVLDIANFYIFSEIFCFEASDNPALYDSNGNFLVQNALNGETALINYLPSNFYLYGRTNYTPAPGVNNFVLLNGGQDFTTFQLSGGGTNPGPAGNNNFPSGLSYIEMDIFITFADGTTLSINPIAFGAPPGSGQQLMHEFFTPAHQDAYGGPPWLDSQFPGYTFDLSLPFYSSCQITNPPVSLTYSYNFGTFGVWEHTYSQTHTFTAAELNLMEACCIGTPSPILGCTDPAASNYNSLATVDDGSCQYPPPPPVAGCTDPLAINFNPAATIDDGTCQYPAPTGTWVCDQTTASCIFDPNSSFGYATQALCQDAGCGGLQTNTDCTNLTNSILTSGPVIGYDSDSILNATTGLCDDLETGQITVQLPQSVVALFPTANPNGILYTIHYWNTDLDIVYTSYNSGYFDINSGPIPGPQSGELTTANSVVQNNASQQTSITGLFSGNYQIYISFYADGYIDGNGNLAYPGMDTPGGGMAPNSCAMVSTQIPVPLKSCAPTVVQGCTDPNANNYNPLATVDDGSCTYTPPPPPPTGCLCPDGTFDPTCCPPNPVGGCMDPNALNHTPSATFDDGSCEYDFVGCIEDCESVETIIPACIPANIDRLLAYNEECIARSGHRFYTKHITGLGNSCSNMETMKMIIINDLMNRKGLPCIYNCTDAQTPDIGEAKVDCQQSWLDNGSLFWSPANASTYTLGTIVKRAYTPNPNNLPGVIFVAVSTSGLDIDPFSNSPFSGWKRCVTFTHTESETYLPEFIKFAREYCKDCGIPAYRELDREETTVVNTFNVGGTQITVNGSAIVNTNTTVGLTGPGN